jgi:hypothetical protein
MGLGKQREKRVGTLPLGKKGSGKEEEQLFSVEEGGHGGTE